MCIRDRLTDFAVSADGVEFKAHRVALASRMPDSKSFRKYPEHDASATRWALNSTPSALTAKLVSRSSRQRATSEAWCGTPPLSVSLGAAPAGWEEDDEEEALVAAVRARFGAIARGLGEGVASANGVPAICNFSVIYNSR